MILDILLDEGAIAPSKAHDTDAGLDLYAPLDFAETTITRDEPVTVDTKVHVVIPDGYCGLLVSKSGLDVNHGITTTGLIDAGYTGTIKVKMYKHEGFIGVVQPGDKISQLVIIPIPKIQFRNIRKLPETDRGTNGFGSSGRK